jgi:type I restriction enzyme S subunit
MTQRSLTASGLKTGSRSVPRGSLLVSTRAPIGYVAEAAVDLAFNQGCRGLVPRDLSVNARFVKYQLLAARSDLQARGNGTTFQELTAEALGSFPIVYREIDRQRRISDFLDDETGRIDALIATKQQMILLGQQRLLSAIDQLTVHWRSAPLRRLATVTVGIVVNPSTFVAADGDVPFIRGVDVRPFAIDLEGAQRMTTESSVLHRKSMLLAGDVVAVRVGDPGVAAVVPEAGAGSNCASLLIIRPDRERLAGPYLAYVINGPSGRGAFRAFANGAAQLQVNATDVVDLQVPCPPLVEQVRIAEVLDTVREGGSALASTLTRQIELLRERRQALITAAVTGELEI